MFNKYVVVCFGIYLISDLLYCMVFAVWFFVLFFLLFTVECSVLDWFVVYKRSCKWYFLVYVTVLPCRKEHVLRNIYSE